MSQDLHKLTVSIEAQINQFKKACDEVKRQASDTAKSANDSLGSINDKKSANAVQRTIGKMKELHRMMKEFSTSAKMEAGLIAPTKQAGALQAMLEATQERAERLQELLDGLGDSAIGTQPYINLTEQLANAKMEAAELEREIKELGVSGAYASTGPPSFIQDMRAYMAEARREVGSFLTNFRQGFESTAPPGLVAALDRFRAFRTEARDAGSAVKRFAVGVKNDLVSAGKGLGSILSRIPLLGRIRGHTNGAARGFRQMRRGILGTAIAIGSAVFSFNALRNGMANLEQYSGRTRNDLNTLRGALLTVQNALATAFAPILSVVVPILTTLMNYVTAAATAVAHFIAALTGSATVVVAKNVGAGVSDSMGGAAGATNDANDAAEKYKRTLMGFDEINKLDEPTQSAGSGGSSGGGGAAGGGVGGMFETVEVTNAASEWAKRFKEAWENADFTEIGGIVGQKLKDALDSIDWTLIQNFCNKVAKSIATFLNGFLETPGLFDSVGTTIAQALNTVFGMANTFATVFHWDSLGKAVSDTVNAFFKTFNFKLAAETISNIANGILTFFTTAVNGIDWSNVGSSIVTFFANIKWADLIVNALGAVDSIVTAIHGLLKGAIETAVKNLKSWIESGQIWTDLFKVGKAALDLSLNLVGTAWDLINTLLGGAITVAVSLAKAGWNTIKDFVGDKASVAIGLAKDGWSSVAAWVKEKLGGAVSKAIDLSRDWSSVASWVKDHLGGKVSKGIGLVKSSWSSVASWVKDRLGGGVSKGIGLTKSGWTSVAKWVKNRLGGTVSIGISLFKNGWSTVKGWLKAKFTAGGGIFTGGGWHPVTAYASGGSPAGGQMFLAREAGPELVGTIGGHTAVMNNDQIVSSVAAGVAKAVAATIGSGNSREIHIHLEGDAKQMFRVVKVEAENYTNSTGLSPFPV